MKLGLHISDFTWEGGAPELRVQARPTSPSAPKTRGVDRISVMDHVWQIGHIGPPEHEMLEAYTALGWLAAKTERVKLLTMVTAVVYREPGLLAKAMTTLDVLSGGPRDPRHRRGLERGGVAPASACSSRRSPSGSSASRRRSSSASRCGAATSAPFDGKHYHLARTLNSPQALSRPHPPILIGGSGEKKTLKLVARYADACNIAAYDLAARRPTSSRCSASTARTRAATTTRSRRPPRPASTWARTARTSSRRSSSLHAGRRAGLQRRARLAARRQQAPASSTCSPSRSSPPIEKF